jgi:restriction system protein
MSLWMVRGDKYGQHQRLALDNGIVYHASSVPDLSARTSREFVLELLRTTHPEGKEAQLRNWAAQLYAFAHRLEKGDLVAMPLRSTPQVAVGRVKGAYEYRTDLGDVHHTRPVEWLREDIPRTAFAQDLLYFLGAFMTVCQIQRNNAEERVLEILKDNKDPGPDDGDNGGGGDGNGGAVQTDVERLARDQILRHLEQNFRGHDLSRLVEGVLKAEGYTTRLSQPGPDGGADILCFGGDALQ